METQTFPGFWCTSELPQFRTYRLKDNGDPKAADYPYRSLAMMLPYSG